LEQAEDNALASPSNKVGMVPALFLLASLCTSTISQVKFQPQIIPFNTKKLNENRLTKHKANPNQTP
jgi:hypothetical protein